jgi:hypothetical protein
VGVLHEMVDGGVCVVGEGGGGVLGELGQIDALGGGGHHHAGEARTRFTHLQGHQRPTAMAKTGGELRQARLGQHRGGVGAKPAPQLRVAEQLLQQLDAALDVIGPERSVPSR